jgi:rhamnose transport system permease protein
MTPMLKRILSSREAILALAILALIALISTRFPGFATPANLANAFNDTAPLILLALGQMIVILTKCIDLSVAANLALTGMVVAMLNTVAPGVPVAAILLIALTLGALMGAANGVLVWKLQIPPIVVTLGTMTIFRGIIFLISDGQWVNAHEMSPAFKSFPRHLVLGLPVLGWIAILAVAVFYVVTTRTPLGRALFAVGGNPHASVYTGINVGKTQFWAFVMCGTLAGLTGYLWVARYAVAYVDIAGGFELEVVAACVIGGVSIAGGIGSVGGALLGALFLGVVKNALPVVNISPFWQLAISGSAIIIAIAFNAQANRVRGRVILKRAEHAA